MYCIVIKVKKIYSSQQNDVAAILLFLIQINDQTLYLFWLRVELVSTSLNTIE